MNHLEGYKSKKFDNGKRMFTKMQILSSVAYKNGEICIHAVSSERFIVKKYICESSIFTKFFSSSFSQDGRCNRNRSRT